MDINLDLTPDQRVIREESARVLSEMSSPEAVRRIVDAGGGTDAALWQMLSRELGWCAMAIPEDYGGLGLGATEMAILMELCGERLACTPLFATACLAAPLLIAAGSDAAKTAYLPAIAGEGLAATVAWPVAGQYDQAGAVAVSASAVEDGYVLSGRVEAVVDLPSVGLVLVPARLEDGSLALFALTEESRFASVTAAALDATRPFATLVLDAVAVPSASRVDDDGLSPAAIAEAMDFACLGLAAEQAGAARGVMDVTLAYISERVQFGRTIASFQAIKHRCARLEVDLAEARALVYGAAAGFAGTDAGERALEVAGAKLLSNELLFRASEEAIQMHGGVGFTWEYDPHLYFKRAQAMAALFGASGDALDRVAAAMIDGGDAR